MWVSHEFWSPRKVSLEYDYLVKKIEVASKESIRATRNPIAKF